MSPSVQDYLRADMCYNMALRRIKHSAIQCKFSVRTLKVLRVYIIDHWCGDKFISYVHNPYTYLLCSPLLFYLPQYCHHFETCFPHPSPLGHSGSPSSHLSLLSIHTCILSHLHTHTHAEFAPLAQLAYLPCSPSLVCVHHLVHPRSCTFGISLSSTGTNNSHCIQHNVSVIQSHLQYILYTILHVSDA